VNIYYVHARGWFPAHIRIVQAETGERAIKIAREREAWADPRYLEAFVAELLFPANRYHEAYYDLGEFG
jgi:hypothetical protein